MKPRSSIDTITSQPWPKNGARANPKRRAPDIAYSDKANSRRNPPPNPNAATGTLTIWRRYSGKWRKRGRTHEGVTLREARELVLPHIGEWLPERSPSPVIVGTDPELIDAFRESGLMSAPGMSKGKERAGRRARSPGIRRDKTGTRTGIWA